MDRGRAGHGRRAPDAPVVGGAVPPRVDLHPVRTGTARQLPGSDPVAIRASADPTGDTCRGGHAVGGRRAAAALSRVEHPDRPAVDPHAVYGSLFADGPNSFWLDGSAALEPESQFSVMGDCSGPLAEYITYRVAETTVRVQRQGRPDELLHRRFFDYIDEQLRIRAVPPNPELPFAFGLGYVGYLGYELKADAGSQLVHTSPTADAAFVFADRAVVIDHVGGACHLLALSEEPDDPGVAKWFADTETRIRQLDEAVEPPPPHPLWKLGTTPTPSATWPRRVPGTGRPVPRRDPFRRVVRGVPDQCRDRRPGDRSTAELRDAREISPTPYSGAAAVLGSIGVSASPERFLRIGADRVVDSKPIKGTRPRHASPSRTPRSARTCSTARRTGPRT